MIELRGKHSIASVYTDNIEQEAISQIINLCNQEFVENCKIAIMPDTHAGSGCVIGFTADLGDKVIPNIVGVDIGCGMFTVNLGKQNNLDLKILDEIIRKHIPSGRSTHEGRVIKFDKLQDLYCYRELKDTKRIERSIGTLGGGNHFIEIDQDSNGNYYLVIHSGSRNLGKQVAEHYQNIAIELCKGDGDLVKKKKEIIETYKKQGKKQLIQKALKDLKAEYEKLSPKYPKELCFLTGEWRDQYLHDMNICQEYAALNRNTMASIILDKWLEIKLNKVDSFQTIHNYISFKDNIIRKGAISAYKDEKVLIPMNMRDGSLLCVGKGNSQWNNSAPHGAGRLMSRRKAKDNITLEEFEESMKGIFTTSVDFSTIDESPMAYKPMNEILSYIGDTVEVIDIIKPVYNYKAGE